ncbi:MAG TPA: APC family permease [Streptosporangiaceae bacterium]|jgi:amino acid transporter
MNQYQRRLGPFGLLMVGLGSIIGSGWLFGAWRATVVAGPAAIIAWLIGAVIIIMIALPLMEMGAMFPRSGGMVRYAQYSHGSLVGFVSGWANWVAIVSIIPIEAEASIQYMSSWKWNWAQGLYNGSELTPTGLAAAGVLVVFYFLINYWTVRLFAAVNNLVTVFKFVVPAFTAAGLFLSGFDSHNFSGAGGFAPNGVAAILTAVATSGIVFAFNGFQSPVNLAGEVRNPGRSVPFAVIGSILAAVVIYILLQVAFIGAVPSALLAHGWSGLNFTSPFADLAIAWNLNWLAILLYAGAFVSPAGAGMAYTATSARLVQGIEDNGYFPHVLGRIHPRFGVPRPALWLSLGVSFVFLALFRGWGTLAEVISVAMIISYVTGPVSVAVLRRTEPNLPRPARIAGLHILAPLGFVAASLLLYWSRWPLTGEIIGIIALGIPIYVYYTWKQRGLGFSPHERAGVWLVCYLAWIALLSWLGSRTFGGIGLIPYGADMAVVALSSLGFYYWGVHSGWRNPFRLIYPPEAEAPGARPLGESAPGLAQQS